MPIEINSSGVICGRCGTAYGKRRGNFLVNYGSLYKGIGHMSICKDCVNSIFEDYKSQCNGDIKLAMRQVCRKLDLYWSDKLFDSVEKRSAGRTIAIGYITRLTSSNYAGKCYDDTLKSENSLWNDSNSVYDSKKELNKSVDDEECLKTEKSEISEDVIAFWGVGYTPEMYTNLEQRRSYWMSKFPDGTELDIGTEAIIRQICSLELDINRDRAAGRAVDKSINALNTLLGSASLKPAQKKSEDSDSSIDKTPLGMWAQKLEYERPIKEVDPDFQDVDGIARYISVWFLGHLCKMLGIKNTYCKLYEEEIAKMRIEHPEYEDEDDETMFNDIFSSDSISKEEDS